MGESEEATESEDEEDRVGGLSRLEHGMKLRGQEQEERRAMVEE